MSKFSKLNQARVEMLKQNNVPASFTLEKYLCIN